MTDRLTAFGPHLRALRKGRNLTIYQLADAAGIDFTYLSKVERGRCDPPRERTIRRLADALDVDADALVTSANKPVPVPAMELDRLRSQDDRLTAFLAAWREIEAWRREHSRLSVRREDRAASYAALDRAIAMQAETAATYGVFADDIRAAGRVVSKLLDGEQ